MGKTRKDDEIETAVAVENTVLAEVKRSETEVIRVSKREYKAVPYVDVRIFFKAGDGEYRPTRKGITVTKDIFAELAEGIRSAQHLLA